MTKNQEEIDRRNDQIAVNQEIANNENEQREIRERAREKVEERRKRGGSWRTKRKLREALPLREQVLEIFKNYGFTLLATGVTFGAAIGALFNALKKVDKGIGKGLQTMSKILGLTCAIVSFIFKAGTPLTLFDSEGATELDLQISKSKYSPKSLPLAQGRRISDFQ